LNLPQNPDLGPHNPYLAPLAACSIAYEQCSYIVRNF
jgi:hypothetical protein